MQFLFSLGRSSDLCFAELQALLKINSIQFSIVSKTNEHVVLEAENLLSEEIIRQSGGIIKIGIHVDEFPFDGSNAVHKILDQRTLENIKLENNQDQKYSNFGVSIINFHENIREISDVLKNQIGLHYIIPKGSIEISSAQLSNKNMAEFVFIRIEDQMKVFQTIAFQNIDHWTRKDVERPFVDDRLGMLPLKVSRMLINISKAELDEATFQKPENISLLDPFCGMGSILAEAIDLKIGEVIGADVSSEILTKCEKNITWFKEKFKFFDSKTRFINSDAAKIDEKISEKIDLIVTEPFMGDARKLKKLSDLAKNADNSANVPKNVAIEVKNLVKGLEKMYLGALKSWRNILSESAVVCLIVPEIMIGNAIFALPFIEIVEKTGYNIIAKEIYSREKAIVRRRIYILKKV